MVETSIWMQKVAADPGHSDWYIERFRAMARGGDDLAGEARFVDAMAPRGARILDAGCGPGRVGGYLAAAGHQVVGVDVDPALIEAAEQDHPGPQWLVGDPAELDLPARGITESFDIIVSAGSNGRAVIGFGAGRDYEYGQFFDDAGDAGFAPDLLLSAWDVRPFTDDSEFLVAILRPA